MASKTIQFNAIIEDDLGKRVKKDVVEHNVTLGDFATQAFLRFLSLPIAQRRVILADHKKTAGRKVGNS